MTAPTAFSQASGARGPMPREGDFRWVTLWGFPLRVMHWIAALCIVLLVITGFFIGKPYFSTGGVASEHFLMGWVRFTHFGAAAFFVMTAIVRIYWLYAGNKFERFGALFPVRPSDWSNMVKQAKAYMTFNLHAAPAYLGHNPLQQMAYTSLYVAAGIQVLTGFMLYFQADPQSGLFLMVDWMVPIFGGLQWVRFLHHVVSWYFLIFVPMHVYLAVRSDWLEHGGIISSIVTGGKFVEADQEYIDD